jgi:type IV secretion system protein VirD4
MIVVGTDSSERLVTVGDEHAALVFGTPRSGKTRGIVIPSLLAHEGPALVTSSKYDVLAATLAARAAEGPVWVFSVDGRVPVAPGVHVRLAVWNPVPACLDFDIALLHARAMVGAVAEAEDGENAFWYHHAERVVAALLHAAALERRSLADVAAWVLTGDLAGPANILARQDAGWAESIVRRNDGGHDPFRATLLSTASDVLRVFDHASARRLAQQPPFPVQEFLDSNGTLYLCIPAEQQELFAPLVVGLIEEVMRAQFSRSDAGCTSGTLAMFLDELRRVAPIRNLAGYLAEAGSHGVQVLGVLQSLNQARERWGDAVAQSFLTLFHSIVLLPGVRDRQLLEDLSALIGEEIWSPAQGTVLPRPTWPVHALAAIPAGSGLHVHGAETTVVRLELAPTEVC